MDQLVQQIWRRVACGTLPGKFPLPFFLSNWLYWIRFLFMLYLCWDSLFCSLAFVRGAGWGYQWFYDGRKQLPLPGRCCFTWCLTVILLVGWTVFCYTLSCCSGCPLGLCTAWFCLLCRLDWLGGFHIIDDEPWQYFAGFVHWLLLLGLCEPLLPGFGFPGQWGEDRLWLGGRWIAWVLVLLDDRLLKLEWESLYRCCPRVVWIVELWFG